MSSTISKLHQAALDFAAAGIPVFPCMVNGKLPAISKEEGGKGFHDATTDIEQINRWWADADYNIGVCPEHAGWAVIDIEADGLARWKELTANEKVPDTYTVQSPRGGQHLYFEGSAPSTVRKLFKGELIDTRGVGGYVLVPPSIVDGKPYKVLHERDIAPLPTWVNDRVRAGQFEAGAADTELDLATNIARAKLVLSNAVDRGDIAVSGRGGNDRTYRLCCELLNLGLTPGTARSLLEDIWNPHCVPPWDGAELETLFTNAATYAQNEAGAWATAPAADTFARDTLDRLAKESLNSKPERRSRFHPEDEDEQEQGDDPKWLIEGFLPEQGTVLLLGASRSYKSFIGQHWCCGISTNTETLGMKAAFTGPTFYGALEGRYNIKKQRRRAWKMGHQVEKVPDFYVMPAPIIAMEGEVQEFGEQIEKKLGKRRCRLIVLDTAAKMMAGLDENNAADAGKLIRVADSYAEAFRCCVLIIGHSGKDEGRGMRGSSAFFAGFDTVLEAKAHRATKSIALYVRKHKDAPEPEEPATFEGRQVGPSLVFYPTTMAEHIASTGENDLFEPKKVGAALKTLNAVGAENAVTTHVLAGVMQPPIEGMTPEQQVQAQEKTARTLAALWRSKLKAYAEKDGRDLKWCLPA